MWDMICVFIDIILSEPDRPVRLEVGGSYPSLGKKKSYFQQVTILKKTWILGRRHSLLNWLQSQSEKQSVRSMKSQPGGVCQITGWRALIGVLVQPAPCGRESEKMVRF